MNTQLVTTAVGRIEGATEGGVTAFLGVPYAQPPVGSLRFDAPRPVQPWEGTRPGGAPAVAPLQSRSRLESVMGPIQVPGYGEDCLTLNIWTPSADADAKLPVLVWLHGGAYLSGSGSASWYDGAAMARRQEMVVVTVSHRLGALGYLYLPPSMRRNGPGANLGLLDQCLALEWVHEHIDRFGGDAGRVTLGGQSAGAHSILALRTMPRAKDLFRSAIVQSAPFVMPAAAPEDAERVTEVFLDAAGVAQGDTDALLSLPGSRILDAQGQTLKRMTRPGSVTPPLQLIVDGTVLDRDPIAAAGAGSMDHGDLMIGYTSDEMLAFFGLDENFWARDRAGIVADLEQGSQPGLVDRFDAYVDLGADSPAAALAAMLRDEAIGLGTIELAQRRASIGRPAHLYRFTWHPPGAERLGACHCIELPFVFNNLEDWAGAPMLAGADPDELSALAATTQDAWASFVKCGDPGRLSTLDWPPYRLSDRVVMEFGASVGAVRDPVDVRPTVSHMKSGG